MEVAGTCWPELIRGEDAGGLLGWYGHVGHDWVPSLPVCYWRGGGIGTVCNPLIDAIRQIH